MKLTRKTASNIMTYAFMIFMAVLFFFPVYWLVMSSISSLSDLLTAEFSFFPKSLTLLAFKTILARADFLRYIMNSIFVACATTFISMIVCSLGGYALARVNFYGRNVISSLILFTYVIPSVLLVIPIFSIMKDLRLHGSYLSLIIAHTSFSIPFCMWLLRGYFASIPIELEDAGRVDGLTRLGALFRIILPLSLPGLAAASMFTFILSWNEFLFAFILINEEHMKTLPVGIASFWTNTITMEMWSWILASSVIAVIPVLIVFLFIQRYLIEGLSAGALKG